MERTRNEESRTKTKETATKELSTSELGFMDEHPPEVSFFSYRRRRSF
jgi:hypothetical protein